MCLAINIYIVDQVGIKKKGMNFIKLYVISWWCKIKTVAAGGEGNGLFSCLPAERNVVALKMSQRKALGNPLAVIHTVTSRLNTTAMAWPQNRKALNSTTQITHLSALGLDLQHQKKKEKKRQKRFTLAWKSFSYTSLTVPEKAPKTI